MTDTLHTAALIAAMSLGTILLRFLPFLVFSGSRKVPAVILYLGEVLPNAALGMLVIYCLKDLALTVSPWGLPELIAVVIVVAIQAWRHNSIYSILGGTAAYMLMFHLV